MMFTLPDLLRVNEQKNPHTVALVDGTVHVEYGELARRVRSFAVVLMNNGVQRGDRVVIYLPRSVESVVAIFAVWQIGAVGVFAADILKGRQVHHILAHSDASLLITNCRLHAGLEMLPVRCLDVDALEFPPAETSPSPAIGSDLALLIYTSGSTGMPKGIMLTHANLLSGAYIVAEYLTLQADEVILSLLPFSFDYGLNQLLTAFLVGGTLVIQRSPLPADICSTILREGVTGMAGVPLLWEQLAHPRSPFCRTEFKSLRYITNTGGRMPEVLTKQFRAAHPHVRIFLMFGLTEAFRSTYLPPEEVDNRPGSIGKAIPNVEILVLNEKGEPCGPGEVGELVHRGANIAMGYWRDPESTALRFRPAPLQQAEGGVPEIAVYSGDYVKKDEEGFLYYVGRRDQMIKSHGIRVSPEEIEEYLFSSNLLAHAVVFAIPTSGVETAIIAAVVPRDPAAFRAEEMVEYCKRAVPEYMRPQQYWTLERLPQTSSGKPDRVKLRETYLQKHGSGQ